MNGWLILLVKAVSEVNVPIEHYLTSPAIDGVQNQAAAYGVFSLRGTEGTVSQNGIQTSAP